METTTKNTQKTSRRSSGHQAKKQASRPGVELSLSPVHEEATDTSSSECQTSRRSSGLKAKKQASRPGVELSLSPVHEEATDTSSSECQSSQRSSGLKAKKQAKRPGVELSLSPVREEATDTSSSECQSSREGGQQGDRPAERMMRQSETVERVSQHSPQSFSAHTSVLSSIDPHSSSERPSNLGHDSAPVTRANQTSSEETRSSAAARSSAALQKENIPDDELSVSDEDEENRVVFFRPSVSDKEQEEEEEEEEEVLDERDPRNFVPTNRHYKIWKTSYPETEFSKFSVSEKLSRYERENKDLFDRIIDTVNSLRMRRTRALEDMIVIVRLIIPKEWHAVHLVKHAENPVTQTRTIVLLDDKEGINPLSYTQVDRLVGLAVKFGRQWDFFTKYDCCPFTEPIDYAEQAIRGICELAKEAIQEPQDRDTFYREISQMNGYGPYLQFFREWPIGPTENEAKKLLRQAEKRMQEAQDYERRLVSMPKS